MECVGYAHLSTVRQEVQVVDGEVKPIEELGIVAKKKKKVFVMLVREASLAR
jgi:hypothetical protein